jgi:hypothetical protein
MKKVFSYRREYRSIGSVVAQRKDKKATQLNKSDGRTCVWSCGEIKWC